MWGKGNKMAKEMGKRGTTTYRRVKKLDPCLPEQAPQAA